MIHADRFIQKIEPIRKDLMSGTELTKNIVMQRKERPNTIRNMPVAIMGRCLWMKFPSTSGWLPSIGGFRSLKAPCSLTFMMNLSSFPA